MRFQRIQTYLIIFTACAGGLMLLIALIPGNWSP